jgi:O-antigen ligase
MSFRRNDSSGAMAALLALPIMGVVAAVFAGTATAVVASMVGYRAVYYVAILGLIAVGGIVTVTRREPLRFAFLALIAGLPIAAYQVPPGRLGFMVFDVVMIALTLGLFGRRLMPTSAASEPIFPTRSWLIAWLFAIPCAAFSLYPSLSLQVFILSFAIYAFFLFALAELGRERGFERLVLMLSVVLLVMAIGLFVDHFLHVNLSLRSSNTNQLSYVGGVEVWRAGGFFQDPQKAGAFLASMITFLLLLAIRGRFRDARTRLVVWAAIVVGSVGLITTISRAAIFACLFVSGMALFAFNRWNAAVKLLIAGSMISAVVIMALIPMETWLEILPAVVAERFQQSRLDFEHRLEIWFDTWNMFADHPMTGIGLGSFQSYLIDTRPGVFNYYGIGVAQGIVYVPDQPESGYLKILYEGGIAGSIAALLVAADAIRRAIGIIAGRDTNPDARSEGIAALAGLATFAATFITLYTVSDPRIAAILAFLLAVIWHRSLQRARVTPRA